MTRFLIFATMLFSSFSSFTQNDVRGKASVIIVNEQNAVSDGATVELLRSKDSVMVKSAITNKNGVAEFDQIKAGSYLIKATTVGYIPQYSVVFTISADQTSVSLPTLMLETKASTQLTGVTVTAKKPFIQKLADRLVVNVDNSIVNAGSSALDVLERSPGITIDQNDAISLRGKAGVIIMIDGKPSPMSGQDLSNYLRGLPSNAIESIHIITNPSAKYDAAGNSGIIDIKMKKDQRLGTNGTFNLGYGQGVNHKANTGATFNYRNKKVNLFGNYNYTNRKDFNNLIINRNFYDNGVFLGSDDKDNYTRMSFTSHNARFGADFFPNKKTIVGFVLSSSFNSPKRDGEITTIVNDRSNNPKFQFLSNTIANNKSRNAIANVNIKHTFDSTGKEITADIDYGFFNMRNLTTTASSFFEMSGAPKGQDEILDGDQLGKLKLQTAKVDYANPLKNGGKFEVGFKTSLVSTDNNAKFFNVFPTVTLVDEYKTNHFLYKEYNNAAYANFGKTYKKFNFLLGLRGEHTLTKTRQIKGDIRNENDYFRLFPSAFFNYNLKENKIIGLSVSRRIDRPGYSQLNPFLMQIDPTIYSTGNPFLKPQMTWSYEMSYTVKNMNFTFGYSHTTDVQNVVLSKILDILPDFEIKPGQDSNITIQIPVNLSSSDYIGLNATTPIRINSWWNMINSFNIYYNKFNGNLGGVSLNDGAPAANIKTTNSFTFKKGWSAELGANFNTGGRYGYSLSEPNWGINIGGQKTILKGAGTLRLNVTDIFWTNLPRATVTYKGEYVENWHAYRDTRVANFSFSYRFGNNKVQAARKRTTASEEETKRAN